MIQAQVYRCQNRDCNCEVKVTKSAREFSENPRCTCGTDMKKPYTKPAVRIEVLANFQNRP